MNSYFRKNYSFILIIVLIILIAYIILLLYVVFTDFCHNSTIGQKGDLVGGLLSPLIGLLSAILVWFAFKEQKVANDILASEQKERRIIEYINFLIEEEIVDRNNMERFCDLLKEKKPLVDDIVDLNLIQSEILLSYFNEDLILKFSSFLQNGDVVKYYKENPLINRKLDIYYNRVYSNYKLSFKDNKDKFDDSILFEKVRYKTLISSIQYIYNFFEKTNKVDLAYKGGGI